MRTTALVAAGILAASVSAAPVEPAVVEQPRAFGHFIGDVLTQRVLLRHGGQGFEPAALPQAARVGVWLERRPAYIETTADGLRWLVVEHQIVNAPRQRANARLPAWELRSARSSAVLQVGAWPFTVLALAGDTPADSAAAAEAISLLRPDRVAPTMEVQSLRQRSLAIGAACSLVLLVWAAWWGWRNWRAASQQPFARALRELAGTDDASPQAWQALHRAFDQTAGRVTRAGTLPTFFAQRPEFEPLRAQIECFFAHSAEVFFGAPSVTETMPLRPLCRTLRSIERRFER